MFQTWTASYSRIPAASSRSSSMVTEPSYSRSACVTVARWILDLRNVRRMGSGLVFLPARLARRKGGPRGTMDHARQSGADDVLPQRNHTDGEAACPLGSMTR